MMTPDLREVLKKVYSASDGDLDRIEQKRLDLYDEIGRISGKTREEVKAELWAWESSLRPKPHDTTRILRRS